MIMKKEMQQCLEEMYRHPLFIVDVDKEYMWNLYLDSFPPGTNEIFRVRREYDCSACRHFIRDMGNVVAVNDDYKIMTIWDFEHPVANAMAEYVKSKAIKDVFLFRQRKIGVDKNREMRGEDIFVWEHFYTEIPEKYVSKDIDTKKSLARANKEVLKRSFDEITPDAVNTVLDIISQGSLYKGAEWLPLVEQFGEYQERYMVSKKSDIFCWVVSQAAGDVLSKIKNHSIGVLLTDISEGMALVDAVRRYEKIVAPANYKRPKAIFTQKMLKDAEKMLCDLGYMDSLPRRFATLDDICINNILFANRDTPKHLSKNVFDKLSTKISAKPREFEHVESIPVAKFLTDVLPRVSEMDVWFDPKYKGNLVSLIAPVNPDSKIMFKWPNNFSWAYAGNLTDSMKERVKNAGGNIDAVLRFSIQWNENGDNRNDFDAHCRQPVGPVIMFLNKGKRLSSSGMLDVDVIHPEKDQVAIENITWTNINKMPEGEYEMLVHVYSYRGGESGFRAQIEFDDIIYEYDIREPMHSKQYVPVDTVVYSKEKGFSLKKGKKAASKGSDVWNIRTNTFVPVTVCMKSPNYWEGKSGHEHLFFMLRDCVNDTQPNGFYNEFLKEDLLQYKRVFEALGGEMKVASVDNQLSGLGFSMTQRAEVVCQVRGSIDRVLKIQF